MSIDFGIRLHRSQFGGISDFPALFHNLLDSLSEQITTIWPDDHLQFGTDNVFEGWTLAAYLAGAFPRFKYGHLVNAQGFRNPALLAKMAAGMQHLTGGRFILGIGAGWHKEEFDAYNLNFAAPGVRIEQLAETIQILRAMWTQSPATYHGKHYRVENAYCTPQPNPPPRILVGTGGE